MSLLVSRRRDHANVLGNSVLLLGAAICAFVGLMAIFEFVGVPLAVISFLMIAVPLIAYAGIGIGSRSLQVVEFFVAGRRVPAIYSGMAAAGNWIGTTTLFGLTGALFFTGFDGLALLLGWTGGFVIVAVLFAPYLRKYGAFTAPDFLAARFGSATVRFCGVIVLVASTAALMTAEFHAGGLIAARALGTDYPTGVYVMLGAVLFCVVLGGMRGLTWSQIAQFTVMVLAVALPVTVLAVIFTGNPLNALVLGGLLDQVVQMEGPHAIATLGGPEAIGDLKRLDIGQGEPFSNLGIAGFLSVVLCLMFGTASMPHVLMRYFTATQVASARNAAGWSLLFVAVIFAFTPAVAALAKIAIFDTIIGAPVTDLPEWINTWTRAGFAFVVDSNGNGRIGIEEFFLHPDIIFLALPEIGGLPFVITMLVAAGCLAAALSTASGLVLAISSGISHDIYYRLIDPAASTAKRLVVARMILIAVACGAVWLTLNRSVEILALLAWSFSLAAAGNFPILVLAIWWRRCTKWGAAAGMISGFGTTLAYLIGIRFFGWSQVFGLGELAAGLLGVGAGFVVAIGISLISKAPSPATDAFLDDIRTPLGQSFMERERAAERIREAGSAR